MNIAWQAGWLRCPQFKPQTVMTGWGRQKVEMVNT